MGAAIGSFKGAQMLRVPRTRFAPVKTTDDLLVLRSDNFFELGGDSILSIQVVSRARQAGLHLDPRRPVPHPTVAALAAAATADRRDARRAGAGDRRGAADADPALVPRRRPDAARLHPVGRCIDLAERLDEPAAAPRPAHRVAHHDALRMRFTATTARWHQYNAGRRTDVCARRRRSRPGRRPADRAPNRWTGDRLLLVVHHLVVDGVSWRILLEDLETAYRGAAVARAKTTSFRDWALRLAEPPDRRFADERATGRGRTARRRRCRWTARRQHRRPRPRGHRPAGRRDAPRPCCATCPASTARRSTTCC